MSKKYRRGRRRQYTADEFQRHVSSVALALLNSARRTPCVDHEIKMRDPKTGNVVFISVDVKARDDVI